MDGLWRAIHADRVSKFLKRHVWIIPDQTLELLLMARGNFRLRSREAMPRGDVARAPSLLQQLLDHTQRDVISRGDLLARALPTVIRHHDTFAQIIRQSSHALLIAWRAS